MKITAIRAYGRDLRLRKPYTIAYETITSVENVFVEVELANGIIGLGAANPAPEVVGETPAQTLVNVQDERVASVAGQDIRLLNGLIRGLHEQFPNAPGTVAALDMALHDAFGQWLDVPVAAFYGQAIAELPTSVTIGILNVADTLAEADEFVRLGFRVLKVKTGLNLAEDAERVRRLRERFGTNVAIRVDANQGYSLTDLHQFLKETALANVELIEQPLPVGHENELRTLPANIRQRLVADEGLTSPESAMRLLIGQPAYGVFNIKLMKCGGIRPALAIATLAQSAGVRLFWGCNDESIVSITAALHAAFASPNTRYLDLDGSFDLAEDIVAGGFRLRDGCLSLTGGAGLGLSRLNL